MSTLRHHPGPGAATDRGPSPYLIGAAIGLLNICAFAAFRKGIGVSGAYESSAALAARRLAPDAAHVNDYVKARKEPPKFNWESWLVLGTILGGMAAAGILFGALQAGGRQMQVAAGVSIDLIAIIQALIIVFIAAPMLVRAIAPWAFRSRPGARAGVR